MGQISKVHRGLAYGDGVMSGAGLAGKLVKLSGADTFALNTDATVASFGILAADCADGGRPTVYCDGGIYETDVYAGDNLQPDDGLYCGSDSKLTGGYDDATQAIKASKTFGAADHRITLQALNGGTIGHGISLTMVKNGNNTALAVTVSALDISVALATGATGDITSTCADVVEAINEDAEANLLVRAASSDGTGLVAAASKTVLAGGADAAVKAGTVISIVDGLMKFLLAR